jgi:hypothetical protein
VKALVVFGLVVGCVLVMVAVARWGNGDVNDPPEVAAGKRNLLGYARSQHDRAERLERLLREVRAHDDVLPALPSSLRERLDSELDDHS